MLHVLLFILKILEIILLAVLGIILAGVLLALFVSVQCTGRMEAFIRSPEARPVFPGCSVPSGSRPPGRRSWW